MPYSSESPPSQSRRPSQSGAAARVTDLPSRSESDVTPSDSLYSFVTKKALVSVAGEMSSSVMPAASSRSAPSAASSAPVTGLERLGVAAVLLGVEEVDDATDVFRHDVDAVGEGRHVGVARVDQLGLDGVAGVLEQLLVHRGDERGLGEVLAGDRDRPLVGGGRRLGRVWLRRRRRGRLRRILLRGRERRR